MLNVGVDEDDVSVVELSLSNDSTNIEEDLTEELEYSVDELVTMSDSGTKLDIELEDEDVMLEIIDSTADEELDTTVSELEDDDSILEDELLDSNTDVMASIDEDSSSEVKWLMELDGPYGVPIKSQTWKVTCPDIIL